MKKVLLFSILFFALPVFAYETIIIKFPEREHWVKAYYKKSANEAILQYVPNGQSSNNWRESVVIHSYKNKLPINVMLSNSSARLMKINPTAKFKTLRLTEHEGIIGRCTDAYKNVEAQCEFFRATKGFESNVTIHYMNKNKQEFMNDYHKWYNIVKRAKMYNSYYRDERTLDKAEYFEL